MDMTKTHILSRNTINFIFFVLFRSFVWAFLTPLAFAHSFSLFIFGVDSSRCALTHRPIRAFAFALLQPDDSRGGVAEAGGRSAKRLIYSPNANHLFIAGDGRQTSRMGETESLTRASIVDWAARICEFTGQTDKSRRTPNGASHTCAVQLFRWIQLRPALWELILMIAWLIQRFLVHRTVVCVCVCDRCWAERPHERTHTIARACCQLAKKCKIRDIKAKFNIHTAHKRSGRVVYILVFHSHITVHCHCRLSRRVCVCVSVNAWVWVSQHIAKKWTHTYTRMRLFLVISLQFFFFLLLLPPLFVIGAIHVHANATGRWGAHKSVQQKM